MWAPRACIKVSKYCIFKMGLEKGVETCQNLLVGHVTSPVSFNLVKYPMSWLGSRFRGFKPGFGETLENRTRFTRTWDNQGIDARLSYRNVSACRALFTKHKSINISSPSGVGCLRGFARSNSIHRMRMAPGHTRKLDILGAPTL